MPASNTIGNILLIDGNEQVTITIVLTKDNFNYRIKRVGFPKLSKMSISFYLCKELDQTRSNACLEESKHAFSTPRWCFELYFTINSDDIDTFEILKKLVQLLVIEKLGDGEAYHFCCRSSRSSNIATCAKFQNFERFKS